MHNQSGLGLVDLLCLKYQIDEKIKATTAIKAVTSRCVGLCGMCVRSAIKLSLLASRPYMSDGN